MFRIYSLYKGFTGIRGEVQSVKEEMRTGMQRLESRVTELEIKIFGGKAGAKAAVPTLLAFIGRCLGPSSPRILSKEELDQLRQRVDDTAV